jgi:hypothetical protein
MKFGILMSFRHPNNSYSAWLSEQGCIKTFDNKHEAQKEADQLFLALPASQRKMWRYNATELAKG